MDPTNNPSGTPPASADSNTPPAPNSNDNNGDNSTPPAAPADGASTLTDDQLKLAFEHPRFKELTQAANELKELKKQQDEAQQKALAEQGKFQELAEKREAEANDWRSKYETSLKNNAIIVEATKLGAHDANTVAKLIDGGSVTIKDDGSVEGVEEALSALQAANPYLFKTGTQTRVGGSDTNPQGGANAEFTASQFQNAAFYAKNSEAMDKALKEGRVDLTK